MEQTATARPPRRPGLAIVVLMLVGLLLNGYERPVDSPPAVAGGREELATIVVLLTVDGAEPRYTPIEAADAVFGHDSLAWNLRERSVGTVSLSGIQRPEGDVFGPVDVPRGSAGCDHAAWTAAAARSLPDARAYDIVFYVVSGADCTTHGTPGTPATVWVDRLSLHTLFEGLLGAFDAGRPGDVDCAKHAGPTFEIALSEDCVVNESVGRWWSTPVGWIDPAAVHTVDHSGLFEVACPEASGAAPQILRIRRGDTKTFWDVVQPCDVSVEEGPRHIEVWLVGLAGRAPMPVHIDGARGLWEGETFVDTEHGIAVALAHDGMGIDPATVYVDLDGRRPEARPPAAPEDVAVQPIPSGELLVSWKPVQPPQGAVLSYGVSVSVTGDRRITLRSANGAWEQHDGWIGVSVPHIRVRGARPGDEITIEVDAFVPNGAQSHKTRVTATVPVG